MTPEEEIHDAWMRDKSGKIDLYRFCTEDAKHPVGAVCTGFKWNGKRLTIIKSG